MAISCISVLTYKRIAAVIVGLSISALTLFAQQNADTTGVAAEIVHYGEAILWVKPASLLNEQQFIPFSVDIVKADSARVYVSKRTLKSLFDIQFQSIRFEAKPAMLKSTTSYRNYSQYIAYCDNLQKQYPHLIDCDTIGFSSTNKAIIALKFNPTSESKPGMLWVGSIHGDETQGYVLLQALTDSLIAGYQTSTAIKHLVDNTHIYIIPSFNPDGLFRTNNTPSTSSTRYNGNYEDLNRNFPDYTVNDGLTLSERQPETQALINFVAKHRICLSAGIHSGAEVVNYPWDTKAALHPDDVWLKETALNFAKSVQQNGPSRYFTDVSNNGVTNGYAWYLVNGGQQDYLTAYAGSRDFTLEVSENKWLSPENFIQFWNYNKQAMLDFTAKTLMASRGQLLDINTNLPTIGKVWTADTDTTNCGVPTDEYGYFYKFVTAGSSVITSNSAKSTSKIINFSNPYETVSTSRYRNNSNTEITIYPTIFENEINISNPQNKSITVSIYNLNGTKVFETKLQNTAILKTSHLPRGMYLVKIKSLDFLISLKISKL